MSKAKKRKEEIFGSSVNVAQFVTVTESPAIGSVPVTGWMAFRKQCSNCFLAEFCLLPYPLPLLGRDNNFRENDLFVRRDGEKTTNSACDPMKKIPETGGNI
jgi:hypothetical protein